MTSVYIVYILYMSVRKKKVFVKTCLCERIGFVAVGDEHERGEIAERRGDSQNEGVKIVRYGQEYVAHEQRVR